MIFPGMEHKTPGVGSPTGMESRSGPESSEQQNVAPRRKRGRSGKRGEGQEVELTVAGVAWRHRGGGHALVVLARGQGAGQMRSSFATLNVFHDDQKFPVTAPVTALADEAQTGGSRQTLRFLFRLPASAPTWTIDRMVLRWRGTEVELTPPAQPPEPLVEQDSPHPDTDEMIGRDGARPPESQPVMESVEVESAPQQSPPETGSGRYGADMVDAERDLALLHQEIVNAKLELAQLHAEIARARLEYEEAAMAGEYAQRERDRAQQWLKDLTEELEDVERQLAECRGELDLVSHELSARRAALEEGLSTVPPPEPSGSAEPYSEPTATPAPPETDVTGATTPLTGAGYSGAQRDLNAALSQLRSRLEDVLSQPRPSWGDEDAEATELREEASVAQTPVAEPPVQNPEEGFLGDSVLQDVGALAHEPARGAQGEPPAPRIPASLPGQTDREDRESSWFAAALRRLAQDDPEAAGRVLVSILPAQAIATSRSFRYDLVVRDDAVHAVDAHPLDTRVQRLEVPRPMDQTDAWIVGSLEQLGELIAHGKSSFLRVFNRHGLKVKGQRARLDDLLTLAQAPLRLRDLCAVGAPIQPQLLLAMIASSIDRSWIEGWPISIRFDPQEEGMHVCSLRIKDGQPMVMGAGSTAAADFGELTTVAEGSARSLMRLLAGLPSPEDDQANVRGPVEPIESLQGWVRRLELSSL
jgi:hypothetical protein